tara:strand:- start:829 stop:2040 length:1212 start_codon:yes stop_codon:yes gene_type:complete
MTLLDDAKLLTTANAGKAGTLYSIKPDDGSCDLDITRSTTATRVNPSGNIETVAINEPQLDYSDGCGSFWIEAQSTNLITYSTGLPSGGWSGGGIIWNANTVVAPDGTTTGNLVEDSNGSGYGYLNMTVDSSTSYTFSFYAKRGTATQMKFYAIDTASAAFLIPQTDFYPLTNSSTWTRVTATFTTGASTTGARIYFRYITTGGNFSLWGLQLEKHVLSFGVLDHNVASSYIPTSGATVTRNATSYIKTGVSGLIGSSEGVVFVELAFFYNASLSPGVARGQSILGIGDSSNDSLYQLGKWSSNFLGWMRDSAGNNILFSQTPVNSGAFTKMALKYKAGDHAYWKDGVELATSTDATAVSATQDKVVSSYRGNSNFWSFYGKIRSIQVYNTALTDAQLLALTT